MKTTCLFLGVFALALILPLLLVACDGSDEPTDGPSSGQATAALATAGAGPSATPTATARTADGANLARNGPGSAGRPL